MTALDGGSIAAKDFADKLRIQMAINREAMSNTVTEDDKIKTLMSLAEVVYSDLNDGNVQYPTTPSVTTKKSNATCNTQQDYRKDTNQSPAGSDHSGNYQNRTMSNCPTCCLREHRAYTKEIGVRGPCTYWRSDMTGPDAMGIATAEFRSRRVIALLNKYSDKYKAYDVNYKIDLEQAVARLVSMMEKHQASFTTESTPKDLGGTKVGRTSKVIRTVRELKPINNNSDSLTVIEGTMCIVI
jgi:hypothetical protein